MSRFNEFAKKFLRPTLVGHNTEHWIWRTYLVEFTKYGRRVFEELTYLDAVDSPERSVGSTVTVNVNKQKRIGIIHGVA